MAKYFAPSKKEETVQQLFEEKDLGFKLGFLRNFEYDEDPWVFRWTFAQKSLMDISEELKKEIASIGKIDDKVGARLKEIITTFKQKMGYGAK